MKLQRKVLRRLTVVATTTVVLIAGLTMPASAAFSQMSVTPTNPLAGGASNAWTIATTGGAAANCIRVAVAATAAGTTAAVGSVTAPAGVTITGLAGTGFTTNNTPAGGAIAMRAASNQAIPSITLTASNPTAAGSAYVRIETYTGASAATADACTSGTLAEYYTGTAWFSQSTLVSVNVDASFSFTVGTQTADCNNAATTASLTPVASTTNAVPLGTLNASNKRAFGSQKIDVSSNAANGWTISMASSAATAPVMKGIGNASNTLAQASTGNIPAADTEFFGFTTDLPNGGSQTMSANQITAVPANLAWTTIGAGSGVNNLNGVANKCVGYAAGIAPTTKADSYETSIVYRAVPSY